MTVRYGHKNGRKRVGLLGGSFNPAHKGHRHLSINALKRLCLDEVWWLVSPLNPFKKAEDMDSYEHRLQEAEKVANHKRIVVSAFERDAQTRYSIDTVKKLLETYPDIDFIWLVGADIFPQFHLWRCWREIMTLLPIAIFSRKNYAVKARHCKTARTYRRFFLPSAMSRQWFKKRLPCWLFLKIRKHPASSTAIRRMKQKQTEKDND